MRFTHLHLLLIFLFISPCLLSQSALKGEAQRSFHLMFEDPSVAGRWMQKLSPEVVVSDALLQAYRGAAVMAVARFERKIEAKRKGMIEGKHWVEKAVAANTQDVDIRIVRYVLQSHLPAIAGYSQHRREDSLFIRKYLQQIPASDRRDEIRRRLKW